MNKKTAERQALTLKKKLAIMDESAIIYGYGLDPITFSQVMTELERIHTILDNNKANVNN